LNIEYSGCRNLEQSAGTLSGHETAYTKYSTFDSQSQKGLSGQGRNGVFGIAGAGSMGKIWLASAYGLGYNLVITLCFNSAKRGCY
jgi:hypothetical protein